jgi:hypothetical protein
LSERLMKRRATPTTATPAHSRAPRCSPSATWESTSSSTIPDTKIGCTTEIGTSERATICRANPPSIEANPATHAGEDATERTRCTSRRACTSGRRASPCFSSTKPTL